MYHFFRFPSSTIARDRQKGLFDEETERLFFTHAHSSFFSLFTQQKYKLKKNNNSEKKKQNEGKCTKSILAVIFAVLLC